MDIKDIRALGTVEINGKIAEIKRDLFKLRFQAANQQLKNNQEIRQKKSLIARMNTVVREKLRGAVQSELKKTGKSN
ncbi:MAG: 50S ribosomal protein L29 [Candidatus Margulisiibacteriota bacterium]|jgi:large subunit ribosomal protein L29